jgi:hypothetical protein
MHKSYNEIIELIKNNKVSIFNNLDKESIEVYKFLVNRFKETEDISKDEVYKFLYRSFYRIDNAGLTMEFKNEYFKILQEYRIVTKYSNDTIISIANRLDPFIRLNNTKSFQFSFISKMLNTINVDSPIWDSEVRLVFKFTNIKSKLSLDEKIKMAIEQLEYMKIVYKQIEESNELNLVIQEFDKNYDIDVMSFNKKLDFILWSCGKIINKSKNIK